MRLVPVDELAEALNVSPRRVQQLVADGMPKAKRGRYNLIACFEWYVRFLQQAVEHRQSMTGRGTPDDVRRERARLLQAQAEKAERENKVASGELVPIAEFKRCMSTMIVQARQQLLQLPARVAPQLEGEPRAVIKSKLTQEVHEALASLARPMSLREPCNCDGRGTATPMDPVPEVTSDATSAAI